MKETRYDPARKMASLEECLVSKVNSPAVPWFMTESTLFHIASRFFRSLIGDRWSFLGQRQAAGWPGWPGPAGTGGTLVHLAPADRDAGPAAPGDSAARDLQTPAHL